MPVRNPMGRTQTVKIDGNPVRIAADYHSVPLAGRRSEAKLFVQRTEGHFAIGRTCTVCGYSLSRQKERNPGRGWGMREGNILRGKLIQHVRKNHPQLIGRPMSD